MARKATSNGSLFEFTSSTPQNIVENLTGHNLVSHIKKKTKKENKNKKARTTLPLKVVRKPFDPNDPVPHLEQ